MDALGSTFREGIPFDWKIDERRYATFTRIMSIFPTATTLNYEMPAH